MANETELKYMPPSLLSSSALFNDPVISPFCGKLFVKEMETTYLDTEDFSAAASGITLRRRIENGESIIYAKTAKKSDGALSVRGEWSVVSAELESACEKLSLCGAPTEKLCGKRLVPIGRVRFTRQECEVSPYEGFSFMLSFDEGFFREDEPFSEIELELIRGTEAELRVFGEKLKNRLGLLPQAQSKYARSLFR